MWTLATRGVCHESFDRRTFQDDQECPGLVILEE